jgi:hypothetical protein
VYDSLAKKFGLYELEDGFELEIKSEKISLKELSGGTFRYTREHEGETVAERLFSDGDSSVKLALWPARPINIPQPLGRHIMLRLNPAISLPPESQATHHLTMPIEIGVFTVSNGTNGNNDGEGNSKNYMIDTFSLIHPRYALYGPAATGYICRLHDTAPNHEVTPVPYEEAAVIMRFENNLTDWVTITRLVLEANMVDLYSKEDIVYLEDSHIVIENGKIATVFLNNKPPLPGLQEVPMPEITKKIRLSLLDRTGLGSACKSTMEYGY